MTAVEHDNQAPESMEFVGDGLIQDQISKAKNDASIWATDAEQTLFWSSGAVVKKISPGLYKAVSVPNIGPCLRKMIAKTDDLVLVDEDGPVEQVYNEIMKFWSPEVRANYTERGYLYKRGLIMHGPPGSGKTAAVHLLVKDIIEKGGIALFAEDAGILVECLQMTRRINPDVPIIVILEDFEILTNRGSDENTWLSVMDGESQIDNVVFVATTNHIQKLPERFINRPSRFDIVVSVPMPSALTRATFLARKEPDMSMAEIRRWVRETKGQSIAHIKELLISVKILGKDVEEEIARIRSMREGGLVTEDMSKSVEAGKFGINKGEANPREQVDWQQFGADNDLEYQDVPPKKIPD